MLDIFCYLECGPRRISSPLRFKFDLKHWQSADERFGGNAPCSLCTMLNGCPSITFVLLFFFLQGLALHFLWTDLLVDYFGRCGTVDGVVLNGGVLNKFQPLREG